MADVKVVIKIPRKIYKAICDKNALGCDIGDIKNIIRNGTPLPKGHGDLIDRDELLVDSYCTVDLSGNEINIVEVMKVKMADAIIEADKE